PVAVGIMNEIQTGLSERDGAEFHMSAQQTLPAQTHRDRVGAEEIFVAEAGIFGESYRLGFQRRAAPKAEIIAPDRDRPAENRLELPGDSLLQPSVGDQQRNSDVGQPEQHQK